MLNKLNINEKSIFEKLEKVKSQFSDYGIKGLDDDIEKSHLKHSQFENSTGKYYFKDG